MKKINKIINAISILSIFSISQVMAFDWPQKETASDSFHSYFGQKRGGTLNTSLIFQDTSKVKATDAGNVVAVIEEHSDDFGWFESTLGNAIIIQHKDELETVYGNLEDESFHEAIWTMNKVVSGEPLAESGNSGWQENQSCLEFKVIDSKNSMCVNPRVLMPRIGRELKLDFGTVLFYDKNGKVHNPQFEKWLPAGNYSVYKTRQVTAVPFKTIISINGATVELISYDSVKETKGEITIQGKTSYDYSALYPDEKRQLLGNIQLVKGKNNISLILQNILGSYITQNYIIETY